MQYCERDEFSQKLNQTTDDVDLTGSLLYRPVPTTILQIFSQCVN